MDYRLLTVSLGLFVVVLPCSSDMEVSQAHQMGGHNDLMTHRRNERSVVLSPAENDEYLVDENEGLTSLDENDQEKRGSLFRFGKRQGSLFRFGKRQGSLFRFGKRQGSLFRFGKRSSLFRFGKRDEQLARLGKRSGSLFRFGRSGPANFPAENLEEVKRTLFRFGKRSDLDLMRDSLASYRDLKSFNELGDSKPRTDNFQWDNDYEHE